MRRHGDLAVAVAALVAMELEIWLAADVARRPAAALLAIPATLPLAVRGRYPLPAFAVGFGSLMLLTQVSPSLDERGLTFVLLFVFWLYALGANARGWQAWAGAGVVPIAVAAFVTDDGDPFQPGDIAFGAFIVGGPWLAGLVIRLRRQSERRLGARALQLERERDEQARVAVAEERQRIARELHDVVAHAISVVVVQARGGRRVARARIPERVARGVRRDRAHGQAGARRDAPPARPAAPGRRAPRARRSRRSARLDALAEDVRAAGLPVDVSVEGEPVDAAAGRRPVGLPHRAGGAHERAQARRAARGRACASRTSRRRRGRRGRRRRGRRGDGRRSHRRRARAWSASASASRSSAASSRPGPRPAAASRCARALPYGGGAMIRVLLADDQALVRAGFRMILEAEPDIEVVGEAGDGAEAVALARELRPTSCSWTSACPASTASRRRGGSSAARAAPRVLVLTTFDLDEYVYEALRAGASGFLLKDAPEDAARRRASGSSPTAARCSRRRSRAGWSSASPRRARASRAARRSTS